MEEDNCPKAETMRFCQLLPPPTPEPVTDECHAFLKKECATVEADRTKCEECLEKLESKDHCTLKEEFAYCDAGGNPSPRASSVARVVAAP